MGRPRIGKELMTEFIGIYCEKAFRDEIRALAKAESRNLSVMVRLLVTEALAARKRREPPPAAPSSQAQRAG